MKAIVFAAGLGTRLGEFTREHPKALVPVGGVPMLERVLRKLRDCGFEDVVVNVHHYADQIIGFLRDNHDFGIARLHVSHERELLLETGGGILAAVKLFGDSQPEPILIHNVDILTDFPLDDMMACYDAQRADAVLLTAWRDTRRYLLLQPGSLRMEGWINIATGKIRPEGLAPEADLLRRAFGGVHIISPAFLQVLEEYNDSLRASGCEADSAGICRFSIMDFYIDRCSDRCIMGYEPSGPYRWVDVGKPDSLRHAETLFAGA